MKDSSPPVGQQRMVQRCEISIAEHGVSWADGHPACGRRVTHKIASGTLMCSYHAKQKRWSRYHPEPLNKLL
jgi:hypothetical protein